MAAPTDGYGLFESWDPSDTTNAYARLDTMAAGGFSVVMNYTLISAHATDMINYINHAATKGLKVIVPLHDPRIWRDGTYSIYGPMYADSGNASTGTAFAQYIVGQVSGLAGLWGYYMADEPVSGDHATWSPYSAAIRTTDSTHPRLVVESASPGASNFYQGSSPYFDQCEVGGDDYYPVGNTQVSWDSLATVASGIQSYCTTKGIQSVFVGQAQSWTQFAPPYRCSPFPDCAPYPSASQMRTVRDTVVANMSPRLFLWWSYYYVQNNAHVPWSSSDQHWANLQWASNGVGPRAKSSFGTLNL